MAINVRDVLRSGVLARLLDEGIEVHVFSPAAEEPGFRAEFEPLGVRLHALAPHGKGLFTRIELATMKVHALIQSLRCATLEIRLAATLRKNPFARWARQALYRAGRGVQDSLLDSCHALLIRLSPKAYDSLFAAHRPDVVIGTRVLSMTAPSKPEGSRALDRHLLLAAARLGCPTMVIVASWDNLTTAGFFPVKPDRITVWNETLQAEAVHIHGVPAERIRITGAPQHDAYADPSFRSSRSEFFDAQGLDPQKKLVVITTQTEGTVPHEAALASQIATALLERRGGVLQVLLRLHQLDDPKRYADLEGMAGITIEQAGKRTSAYDDRDFDREAVCALVNTLHHADVVINTASSIAIDATANGTPVICVGFDAHGPTPGERTVRGLYDLTHLKNIVRSGGIEMAGSIDQLLDQVDGFLAHPNLLKEGRTRLIREQCYRIDGQSANRVADAILEVVGAAQN